MLAKNQRLPRILFDIDQLDELDRVVRELRALAILVAATEFDAGGGLSSMLDRLSDSLDDLSDTATAALCRGDDPQISIAENGLRPASARWSRQGCALAEEISQI